MQGNVDYSQETIAKVVDRLDDDWHIFCREKFGCTLEEVVQDAMEVYSLDDEQELLKDMRYVETNLNYAKMIFQIGKEVMFVMIQRS